VEKNPEYLRITPDELIKASKIPLTILPDLDSLYEYFARSLADEIKANNHFPDPLNLNQISQAIRELGGIDTCYGGVGYHGHIAFNEPPISRWYKLTPEQFRSSLTRIVPLAPETIVMNSIRATGGNPAALPPMAVTLGMADIFAAKRIRIFCQGGAWQRTALRIAVLGDEDVDYPVTLLQPHPDYAIFTTQDTAQPPILETAA